jgi:hypothetical protein
VSLWHPQQEECIASNLETRILSAISATFVAIPTLHDSHFLRSGLSKEKCSHFLRFFGLSVMDFEGFREIGCLIFTSKSTNRPISIQILESDNSRFGYKSVQMFFQKLRTFCCCCWLSTPVTKPLIFNSRLIQG